MNLQALEAMGVNLTRVRPRIDLVVESRSRPTEQMWEAMRAAEIDMSMFGDPNVMELQRRVAELAGKEAALYVPTGSAGNLLGLLSLAERGTQVIMERQAHIYWIEGISGAFVGGVGTHLVESDKFGKISPARLTAALETHTGHPLQTSLVWLENTHGASAGCALSPAETAELAGIARQHNASVFVDGARIWNAAVYHNAALAEMLQSVDGAMISMTKALGAPVGSVIVGSQQLIDKARKNSHHLGIYSLHRLGYFAAAALVALDTMRARIPEDHRRARMLAEGLAAIEGLEVDMSLVQTNLLRVGVVHPDTDAYRIADRCREMGLGIWAMGQRVLRAHIYWEITDQDIAEAIDILRRVMSTV